MIYRVQDKQGRGCFKPNFTREWCEYNHTLPAIGEEFPMLHYQAKPYHDAGYHLGCAVRSMDGLFKWFSKTELENLYKLKHYVVAVKQYEVVAESANQVVFATKKPLKILKPIDSKIIFAFPN